VATGAATSDAATAPKPAADLGGQLNDAATKLTAKPAADTATAAPAAAAPAAKDAEKGEKK